jgi:hypothetical protein
MQKHAMKYYCELCDFGSSNKTNWTAHTMTRKHMSMITNDNKMVKNDNNCCQKCGKKYKYASGLSRHKMKCGDITSVKKPANHAISSSLPINNTDILEILKTMSIQNEKIVTQQDMMNKLVENQAAMIPKLGNNNNNKISFNVFLNEHCKNAINITDFIENIQVSLADLEYTNKHGYVEGISNILTKHLTDLKATERPIHCSDKKRLQFYVKDCNAWNKDSDHSKIDHGIHRVTQKQILRIKEWENNNPGWNDSEEGNTKYMIMLTQTMGGSTDLVVEKNRNNIKKSISKSLAVENNITI